MLIVLAAIFGETNEDDASTEAASETSSTQEAVAPPDDSDGFPSAAEIGLPNGDAYDIAAFVFQGSPSRDEVQAAMDTAITLYGNQVNDTSVEGLANVLVAMHNEYGYDEMYILEQMICGYAPGVALPVPDSVAFAVASIGVGDVC